MTIIFTKYQSNTDLASVFGFLERRGETSPGGKAQGRGGSPAAGERQERQRGQGGSAEGQKGQGEGHSN